MTYEINMFRESLETVDNSASLLDQPRPADRYPDGILSSNNEYSEKVNSLRQQTQISQQKILN